jgi:hypothetical protein
MSETQLLSSEDDLPAIHALRLAVGPATEAQAFLAKWVGKTIPQGVPQVVAGALLRVWLSDHLAIRSGQQRPDQDCSDRVSELAAAAGHDPAPVPATREEALAYVDYYYRKRRLEALESLKLQQGDVVRRLGAGEGEVDIVSSVGIDGAVFFRGRGGRAWPDLLEIVARKGEASKEAAHQRRIAQNRASQSTPSRWSINKESELQKWVPQEDVQESDIAELEDAIENSSDEAPIQMVLQERPQLLAILLRRPKCFVRPQVQFSTHYRADFMIADVDSTGVRWVYVELETPNSGVCLQSKQELDAVSRHGLSQIESWREWVQENLDHARKAKREGGLSLFGLRPRDDGLLLVGRAHLLKAGHDVVRRQIWEDRRVRVHTYDWLLRQVREASRFNGVPAANPYILPRLEDGYDVEFP